MRRPPTEAELRQRRAIAKALLRAISDAGASNEKAATWLGLSDRALFGWVHAEQPIKAETVFACPQLGKRFRKLLCTEKHDESLVIHSGDASDRSRK